MNEIGSNGSASCQFPSDAVRDDHFTDCDLEVEDQCAAGAALKLSVAQTGALLLRAEQVRRTGADLRRDIGPCALGQDHRQPPDADAGCDVALGR